MRVEELLARSARRAPDKVAVVCGSERWSYARLDAQANALAHRLVDAGVTPGARVVIALPNSIEAVVALFGVLRADAVFVIVNPLTRPERLARIVDDSGAWGVLAETADPSTRTFAVSDFMNVPGRDDPPLAGGNNSHLAALVYTSGSSGESKGVMLTHRNIVAAADAITEYLENTADDVILNVLPLAFTYGLTQVTTACAVGATLVLERSFCYAQSILDVLAREQVTGFAMVPTIATLLLQQDLTRWRFPHLRYLTNAAAALSASRIEQLRKAFPATKLYSMYGQTECQRISYLPPDFLDSRPGSVGVAIPGTAASIVDDHGEVVGPRVVGELVVSGPHVMSGYWNRPDETAAVLRDGVRPGERVLHTGDLFWRDEDGFLYFVDRKDDVVKTRGEKVAPRQVEEVIAALPGVIDVAVYGVDDDLLGQAIAASLTVAADAHVTVADVKRHCRRYLDDYMVPKYVEICAALPITLTGKVSRRALRELHAEVERAA